ncbi:IucA/IucC family C-terminal-domain containing protein [Paenibacillus sp. OV219]|uniref:IucA/IucC family C-terminal-domain containing protein n=1 Tax=Paenibacillus sp. OV219 TaxID=1884377 RepID=UPI0008AAEF3C|nr:IucA/IucC family C-terminal-domain containing protein [Paenibacillus sp. OV219]SEM88105.1 Ferric iron reductase FhuF-like transporter [Paenibacillus sp. OV219]
MNHSSIDFKALESFYIQLSPEGSSSPSFVMPAADMLRPDTAREALLFTGRIYKSLGYELAASLIGTTLFRLCAGMMVIMARNGVALDLSLENLELQINDLGEYAGFGFRIREVITTSLPADLESRDSFVREALTKLFEHTITPAVQGIAAAGNVKPGIIWNQAGSLMISFSSSLTNKESDDEALARFRQYQSVLTEQLSGELFGSRRNPFEHKPRYIDSPYQQGSKIIIRSGCCMFYCRENGDKCYNCPKLTDEQREERRLKITSAS